MLYHQKNSNNTILCYNNNKVYDFMQWGYLAFSLSVILCCIAVIIMILYGFQLGLDFTGGTVIELHFDTTINLNQIRNILTHAGLNDLLVQYFGSSHDLIIRIPPRQNCFSQEINNNIFSLIHQQTGQHSIVKRIAFIGPSIGKELAQSGSMAIIIALICIFIYVVFRFEWRLATGAIVSLIHDIVITLGILSFFHIEIDMTIIASLISVIGYSLNDSIVVSDRIRENFSKIEHLDSYDIFNVSLTQILNRTIMTSATTFIVVLILLIFGGAILYGFSITLLIGIFIGTISSIYVASALALKLGLQKEHLMIQIVENEEGTC